MAKTDPRIDAYISRAAPFAQPILRHLRAVVHAGCPDVLETIKWSSPSFEHHGLLCGMAAFKAHCTFGFWKWQLVAKQFPGAGGNGEAMGQFGRIATVRDLPSRPTLLRMVRFAARLNVEGVKVPARPRPQRAKAVRAPADLLAALQNNSKARAGYEGLSPSQKREYIEWITEARRDETRRERVVTAVEWMSEGKIRNWKYVR